MKAMKDIIDTWNMIDKYHLKDWKAENGKVLLPESEYNRLIETVQNKKYVKNLLA